ncbi:MAG: hypothetical protein KF782_29835 [Labilithrix sp.]|nr:hypothetical protein [Labilithrix sp.]
MRKSHFARLYFTLTALAAVGVWAACGGSDTQDVVDNDAGADTGADDRDSGGGEDSGGQRDTGPADTGADVKVYDAGQPNFLDAGEEFEGGIPCVVGGELEEEPNDDRESADELKPTRCGVIKIDELDAGESDFLTFTLADASTNFFLQYAGNVRVLVETDGAAPVDITQGSPTLVFRKGQPYYVEVKSKDNKQQFWRVTLFQE